MLICLVQMSKIQMVQDFKPGNMKEEKKNKYKEFTIVWGHLSSFHFFSSLLLFTFLSSSKISSMHFVSTVVVVISGRGRERHIYPIYLGLVPLSVQYCLQLIGSISSLSYHRNLLTVLLTFPYGNNTLRMILKYSKNLK